MTYREFISEILNKVSNLDQELELVLNVGEEDNSYFVNVEEINITKSSGMYAKFDINTIPKHLFKANEK